MSSVLVYTEVKSHLQAIFAPTPVLDFDTIDRSRVQGKTRFLCLEEVFSFETTVGIGSPASLCIRESSTFIVHAFVPSSQSSALARQFAEQVQTALRHQDLNGVIVKASDPPEPEDLNDGLWTAYGVAISVDHDFHFAAP